MAAGAAAGLAGEHLHLCAYRLGKHLQLRCADKRGLIGDIDEALEKYAAKHQVSKRTGWIDLGRLMEAGLLRQVHAAAPERKACYALVMDLAALPDDLPKTLAEALRWHIDNPITIAKGGQTKAAVDEGLAESEVVRYGSAVARRGVPREPIMTALGCGRLHTSPYTREGLPLPSHIRHRGPGPLVVGRCSGARSRRGKGCRPLLCKGPGSGLGSAARR
ncbi:hypothetical protein ACFQYP_65465 [Nonomuraea antimicrobica]